MAHGVHMGSLKMQGRLPAAFEDQTLKTAKRTIIAFLHYLVKYKCKQKLNDDSKNFGK